MQSDSPHPPDPMERPEPGSPGDDMPEPAEDSTRIIEKSRYMLGLLQTRISHLKEELEQRRSSEGLEEERDPVKETEKLLEEARARLRNLKEKVKKSDDRKAGREPTGF